MIPPKDLENWCYRVRGRIYTLEADIRERGKEANKTRFYNLVKVVDEEIDWLLYLLQVQNGENRPLPGERDKRGASGDAPPWEK